MNVRTNRIVTAFLAVCLAFLWSAVPSARNAGLHEDSKEAGKLHRIPVLDGSNVHNVGELQLAWSLALPAGPNAATPLVHDGEGRVRAGPVRRISAMPVTIT